MTQETKHDKNTGQFGPFGDLTQMLEQFKVPGIDMSTFVAARRKDIESMVAANKSAYEAMQALARTQSDMLTQAMQSLQEAAKSATADGGGVFDPRKQSEVADKLWQKMLADIKGLTEMARKSHADAIAAMSQRTNEHVQEIKQMANRIKSD